MALLRGANRPLLTRLISEEVHMEVHKEAREHIDIDFYSEKVIQVIFHQESIWAQRPTFAPKKHPKSNALGTNGCKTVKEINPRVGCNSNKANDSILMVFKNSVDLNDNIKVRFCFYIGIAF